MKLPAEAPEWQSVVWWQVLLSFAKEFLLSWFGDYFCSCFAENQPLHTTLEALGHVWVPLRFAAALPPWSCCASPKHYLYICAEDVGIAPCAFRMGHTPTPSPSISRLACLTGRRREDILRYVWQIWNASRYPIVIARRLRVSRLHICPLYIFGSKATDGTYGFEYWSPGFGFDPGPNLQPCEVHSFGFENMAKSHVIHSCFVK